MSLKPPSLWIEQRGRQLTRYLRIVDPHSGQYHPPV